MMRPAAAVVVAFALLAALAASARADTYPLFGFGSQALHSGRLAADVDINTQPVAIAARPDGAVAFGTSGDGVFLVEDGRLRRVRVPLRGGDPTDLAFAADGTLLVASCPEADDTPAAVFRAGPDIRPTVVAGMPGRIGSSGDGGPATAAKLRCAQGIALDREGGLLIADPDARRVRRVDPQGVIHTVAGNGGRRIAGDGRPAPAVPIGFVESVAALPDGGFAIAAFSRSGYDRTSPAVRVVDPGGVIATRARVSATHISAEADGSLLLTDWTVDDAPVRRLSPDGRLSVAVDVVRDRVGTPEFPRIVGDPFASDAVITDRAVVAADGGLLVVADFGVSYVAPAYPRLLAAAILEATRRVRPTLDVTVRLTRAAHVRVVARRSRRLQAAASLDAPAGDSVVGLGRLPAGLYDVRVVAEEPGQTATAHALVLAGGRLAVRYARDFVRGELGLAETFFGGAPKLARCVRRGALRVDCGLLRKRRCVGALSVRLRHDGSLALRALSARPRRAGRGRSRAAGSRSCPRRSR